MTNQPRVGGRRGPGARWGRHGHGSEGEQRPSAPLKAEIRAWFAGRIPEDWYLGAPQVTIDNEEILIVGALAPVTLSEGASAEEQSVAAESRIARHREETRDQRIGIASEAQARYRRVVSWGASVGDATALFTTANVPAMTRLRQPQRQVLDVLIDAGVARSRSEALAWCVELVGRNERAWIDELRTAFDHVEEVRQQGPGSTRDR